jgi:hypothetical protein
MASPIRTSITSTSLETDEEGKEYTAYHIQVRAVDPLARRKEWSVTKRYNHFSELHNAVCRKHSNACDQSLTQCVCVLCVGYSWFGHMAM